MTTCRGYQKKFAALIADDLDVRGRRRLEEHAAACPACRREMERTRRLLEGAESVRAEIAAAVASVDWEALPGRISARAAAAARERRRRPVRALGRFAGRPAFRPVYAGLLAGLLLGSVATWLVLRGPGAAPDLEAAYHASPEFLDRVELQMARRGALDYLQKSRYLLLDYVEAPSGAAPAGGLETAETARVRELLTLKKYLNPHLDDARMAKAKALCDQIELLFLELARLRAEMSEAERGEIRDLILDRRLLFKIGLVERELEESEV